MVDTKRVEEMGKKLDKMNQIIAQKRLEKDMLAGELQKKAQAYYELTGEVLPTDMNDVANLRDSVEEKLQERLAFLEQAVTMFNAEDYEKLAQVMTTNKE